MILNKLNKEETTLISKSSNAVYETIFNGKKCILKHRIVRDNNLSPFWFQLKELFGMSVDTYNKSLRELMKELSKNKFINTPKLIEAYSSKEEDYQIFTKENGVAHEPDDFPINNNVAYQLGQYIGLFHSKAFKDYGTINNLIEEDYKTRLFNTMRKTIQVYWDDDPELLMNLEELYSKFEPHETFSLIMADISGNQFIYGLDDSQVISKINANVDLDAYVIGPRELELVILNECIARENWSSFVEGYQTQCILPDFEKYMEVYSFYCSLNDYELLLSRGSESV